MRILILNWRDLTHPRAGGAELVTMEHAKGWVKAGHRVTWLTGWYGGKKEEIVDGVHIVRRAGSLTIYLYAMIYLLINSRLIDVIVDEAHGFPFFSPLFTKKPVVLFIHEIAGEIWDYMFPFPKNIIGKFLESTYFRLYKKCYVWTDAPSTVDELVERGIPRNRCFAIPCPIVKPRTKNQQLRTKNQQPTYIFVSRVVRMKGLDEVIKAFAFTYREEPKSKLWIVGGGEDAYIEELKTMIVEYGIEKNVVWFGIVSEKKKYELMSRAQILLHASVKEGWGLVVLEAASVGTPAIVYNVSGLRDVVKHNKTGIVLQTNSPQEMAREAMVLLKNKRMYALYQQNGKKWVDSLRWDDVIKKSLVLLKKAT
ncbi:glycosyltransferase family 4 protein [Patescibacteria group bacterium]|nr:glycosyltransferase family 4 protein [Patescibacteria group bacterium]MBU1472772.1 glycosyltransferase family 4 protein [Patescibacteria group bacterium]MBU2460038.1 glycosyltransferase family 4 protein [Patescibacteria group bacterium]MBU2544304.1 glycosyltransferase family 4 protein [Patescibacteria group bacterium]